MKGRIKKVIVLVIILILIGVGAGIGIWKFQANKVQQVIFEKEQGAIKKQEKANFLFAHDTIYSLIQINRAYEEEDPEGIFAKHEDMNRLQEIYTTREYLLSAKSEMEKWIDNENADIGKIAGNMLDGINDLMMSNDAMLRIVAEESDSFEKDFAFSSVKIKRGREKIFSAPIDIGFEFLFSSIRKEELISYIELNFKDSKIKYREQIERGEEPATAAEAAAALMIEGGLKGLSMDWDEISNTFWD